MEASDAFRIVFLVEGFALGRIPGDARGAEAHAVLSLDARRSAVAAALRGDQTALAVEAARKEVDDVHHAEGFDVVGVARRIPTVVADALQLEEVARRFDERVDGNARDLRGLFGRIAVVHLPEGVKGRRNAFDLAVEEGDIGRVREEKRLQRVVVEADDRAFFVEFRTLPHERARDFVNDGEASGGTALDHFVFRDGTQVFMNEHGTVRPVLDPVEIAQAFPEADVNEALQERAVGARLDRNPGGVAQSAFRHARVDEDELAAVFTGRGGVTEDARGAVEGASHEKEVARVAVVRIDGADAVVGGTEDHAAPEGRSAVAGGRVVDHVRRAERLRKPGLIPREVVRREHDALFTVLLGDFLEFRRNFVQGLIPGNFLEFARANGFRMRSGWFQSQSVCAPRPQ